MDLQNIIKTLLQNSRNPLSKAQIVEGIISRTDSYKNSTQVILDTIDVMVKLKILKQSNELFTI